MSAARTASGAAAAAVARQAVTDLYGEQYRALVRLSALLTGDAGAAELVVQDCFVALHHARRQPWDHQAAVTYLRRAVVSRSRPAQSQAARSQAARSQAARPRSARPRPAPAPAAMPPELAGAIAALPARQREALVLRFYLDLPDAEIAAAMGVSMPAARRHTASATAAMRDVLSRD